MVDLRLSVVANTLNPISKPNPPTPQGYLVPAQHADTKAQHTGFESLLSAPARSSPCCIFCTSSVASGRRSRPLTLRMPVPKHTPHTLTPRPKQFGHSTNSYESLARFLQQVQRLL